MKTLSHLYKTTVMAPLIGLCYGLFVGAPATADNVVGNLSGEFAVNSGQLSYTLPIVTPEGIHGLRPSVSINYSNSSGAGLLGAGFTLSASSSISRCSPSKSADGFKSGIELNDNARFCLNGAKLVAISGSNGGANTEYRNVEDNNTRYFSRGGSNHTPSYWEVHAPDGFKYKYERASATHTRFSAWFLTEKRDLFGNTIQYHYSNGIMPLLQNISYSGYRIDFKYEAREQPIGQYRDGHHFQLSQRLHAIVVSRASSEINRYRFIYEAIDSNNVASPLGKLKRLAQVEKCYGVNGQAGCLKPLNFRYQEQPDPSLGLDRPEDRTIVVPRSYYAASDNVEGTQLYERPSYAAADMNNDGLTDFCYYQKNTGIMCAVSDGTGGYSAPTAWTGNLGYTANEEQYPYYSQLQLIDLNADTYADVCLTDASGVRCALNNKNNRFGSMSYWTTQFTHSSSPVLSFVNDDVYPDVCGLNASYDTYSCTAGTGSHFSGSQLVNLQNIVDSAATSSWQDENCSYNHDKNVSVCQAPKDFTEEVKMPSPQWIDIDGDLDNDLCWLSVNTAGYRCSYRSINPQSKVLEFSPPKTLLALNYSTFTPPSFANSIVSDSSLYRQSVDNVRDNIRRFTATFRMNDINGDLLPDICYANTHSYLCAINKGNSFASASQWINLSGFYAGFDGDNDLSSLVTIRLDDMNNDGLIDFCIVKNQQQHCAHNQIGRFGDLQVMQSIAADVDTNVDVTEIYENFVRSIVDMLGGFGTSWKTRYVVGASNLAYGNLLSIPDINGDGYSEFCYRSIHGILCTSNDNYGAAALLVGVTDSFGQTTDITYGSLVSDGLYQKASTIPTGYYEQPSNALVVDTVAVSSGVIKDDWPYNTSIKNTQSYRYTGFLRNPKTGVASYAAISVTQHERNVSTTTHLSLEEHLTGQQTFIEEFIGNQRVKTKQNNLRVINEDDGRHRVRLDSVEEKQFDLDGTLVSTQTTFSSDYDQYGYPQRATTQKVMAEDGESLTQTTITEYYHDTEHWMLARPDHQRVDHQYQGDTVTREVDYHFANGLMTGETIQPSAPNASSISYTYDATGNTTSTTTSGNGQSRTVSKTFDSLGRVLTLTNSLGQREQFTYHTTCPGVVQHTDVAGKVSSTSYDFACRQQSVQAPDSNATQWQYLWATEADNRLVNQPIDHPFNYRNPIVYKVIETHASGQSSHAWFDAQGREIRSERTGFSSEKFQRNVVTDTAYDRFGRKTATTLPYYSVNGEYITPSWMTFVYDGASRIKSEHKIGPDGLPLTSYYAYDKNSTTVSYSDYRKTTHLGVFGKPLSVDENGLTVSYTYDPVGNLISTDQNGVITTVSYDARGFKTQQNDPAMGVWNYTYNAFGELLTQTDAKNQTTSFVYDELGRLIERTEPEGQTQWVYNASGNGVGQVHQELGINATKQWDYDNLGRTVSETLIVDDQEFVTQFSYDAFSRLIKTINPQGLEVHNSFDSTGAIDLVSIPANQIQGFDAVRLEAEYEAVLLLMVGIENDIQKMEERRAYHLAKHAEYESKVYHYLNLLNEVVGEIERLNDLASLHEDIAARYQQAINDLRAQANAYRSLYGDRTFAYKGISNGRYHFQTSWCSDRHRIWGGCKTRQVRDVFISASNFNTVASSSDSVYASFVIPASCGVVQTGVRTVRVDKDVTVEKPTYENKCWPEQKVSEPSCVTRLERSESDHYGVRYLPKKVCAVSRPYEVYNQAANDFQQLLDAELAKAQAFRDQIEVESYSELSPLVATVVPTGQVEQRWVPIGTDIIAMIPVQVMMTRIEWNRLSLEETVVYYEEKINYYRDLAIQELDAYNSLSREWQDLADDFDQLNAAQHQFAQMLESAGVLVGTGTTEEILADIKSRQSTWENSDAPLMVWAATMRAPNGLLESELFGNGLYTQRTIDKNTGLVTAIKTGAYSATTPLRHINYRFDHRGMIVEKSDHSTATNQTVEQYDYDSQGRLRGWSFDQQISDDNPRHNHLWRTYDYDNRGNMTYKTGAGSAMHYNTANQLVSRDVGEDLNIVYSYDVNGNMLQGDGRQYQWNSFNKVNAVSMGNNTVNFAYDASHRRVVKKSEQETIYYVSPGYEKVIKHSSSAGDQIIHRYHIRNGDDVVASFEKREEASGDMELGDDVKYYHRDHLGNGELVTGADMNVLSQRFYTPYGELVEDVLQREQNASTTVAILLNYTTDDYMREIVDNNDTLHDNVSLLSEAMYGAKTDGDYRGFTSHETIKELGLVNMNARLYDPVIGRFVSADSVIPDLSQPLDYNRYIYVRNNPISYRDPSGHNPLAFAAAFFVGAHLTDSQSLQQLSALLLSVALAFPGSELMAAGPLTAATFGTGPVAAAASAFTTTLTVSVLQTGDVKASVESAAWSALAAGVANGIGHGFDTKGPALTDWFDRALLHGLSQGVISDLRGDKFAAGFASGLVGSIAGHISEGIADSGVRVAIAMTAGYISAEAAGGDGIQGALNAAVVFLYNHMGRGEHGKIYEGKKDILIDEATGQEYETKWLLGDEYFVGYERRDIKDWKMVGSVPASRGVKLRDKKDSSYSVSVDWGLTRKISAQVRVYGKKYIELFKYSGLKTGRTHASNYQRIEIVPNTFHIEYGIISKVFGYPRDDEPIELLKFNQE
ncbi:RHS repeat-associated core domain-containing protein [Eionea flava]